MSRGNQKNSATNRLREKLLDGSFSVLTAREIAERIGKSQAFVVKVAWRMRMAGETPLMSRSNVGRPRKLVPGEKLARPEDRSHGKAPAVARKFDREIKTLKENYLQGNYRGMSDLEVSRMTRIPLRRVYLVRKGLTKNGVDTKSDDWVEIEYVGRTRRVSKNSRYYQLAERLSSGEYSEMRIPEIAKEEGVSIDTVHIARKVALRQFGKADYFGSHEGEFRKHYEKIMRLSRDGELETASYSILGNMLGMSTSAVKNLITRIQDSGEIACLFGMSESSLIAAVRTVIRDPGIGLLRFEKVARVGRMFSRGVLNLLRFLVRRGYLVIPEDKDEKTEIS